MRNKKKEEEKLQALSENKKREGRERRGSVVSPSDFTSSVCCTQFCLTYSRDNESRPNLKLESVYKPHTLCATQKGHWILLERIVPLLQWGCSTIQVLLHLLLAAVLRQSYLL
jgi:hypothetical protein